MTTPSIPAVAAGTTASREDMINAALDEAGLDAQLTDLANREEEPTLDEIRAAVGDAAEGLTDEELQAEWKKAQEAEPDSETEEAEEAESPPAEPFKLEGFKLYNDKGEEITDPTKVSALDLLTGKVVIGYNALSKEQRKGLRDLTRVASLGHYNEKVVNDTRAERQQAMQRASAAEAKVAQYESERRTWDVAMTALANGNPAPMQQLVDAFNRHLGSAPAQVMPPAAAGDEDALAQQFFQSTIVPRAQELGTQYGANPIEIAQYVMYLCEQEGDFLTMDKINAILSYEMPAKLESLGYSANGTARATPQGDGDPRDAKIADLEKAVAELRAKTANTVTQKVREKQKKTPPSGGGSTPGAGEAMPDFKSRDSMKEWLRS